MPERTAVSPFFREKLTLPDASGVTLVAPPLPMRSETAWRITAPPKVNCALMAKLRLSSCGGVSPVTAFETVRLTASRRPRSQFSCTCRYCDITTLPLRKSSMLLSVISGLDALTCVINAPPMVLLTASELTFSAAPDAWYAVAL